MLLSLDLDFHLTFLHLFNHNENNIENSIITTFDNLIPVHPKHDSALYALGEGQAGCYTRMNKAFRMRMGLTRS